MQVILRRDVEGVGHKGDVVDVADGYGRNFLFPRDLAMPASSGALAQAEGMSRARAVLDGEHREAAQEVATKLVAEVIRIEAKAGPEGQLFGSVTPADISAAVAEQTGHEVDRRGIEVGEAIKEVGSHTATAKLHPEVEFPLTIEVIAG
jgi:large subunit ribosomal protein L9